MSKSLAELLRQRERLLERIDSQRSTLARQLAPLQNASDSIARLYGLLQRGMQHLKSHPLPVLLAVAALVLLKPRRAWGLLQGGLFFWRRWRLLRAWLPASLLSRWLLERLIR